MTITQVRDAVSKGSSAATPQESRAAFREAHRLLETVDVGEAWQEKSILLSSMRAAFDPLFPFSKPIDVDGFIKARTVFQRATSGEVDFDAVNSAREILLSTVPEGAVLYSGVYAFVYDVSAAIGNMMGKAFLKNSRKDSNGTSRNFPFDYVDDNLFCMHVKSASDRVGWRLDHEEEFIAGFSDLERAIYDLRMLHVANDPWLQALIKNVGVIKWVRDEFVAACDYYDDPFSRERSYVASLAPLVELAIEDTVDDSRSDRYAIRVFQMVMEELNNDEGPIDYYDIHYALADFMRSANELTHDKPGSGRLFMLESRVLSCIDRILLLLDDSSDAMVNLRRWTIDKEAREMNLVDHLNTMRVDSGDKITESDQDYYKNEMRHVEQDFDRLFGSREVRTLTRMPPERDIKRIETLLETLEAKIAE